MHVVIPDITVINKKKTLKSQKGRIYFNPVPISLRDGVSMFGVLYP